MRRSLRSRLFLYSALLLTTLFALWPAFVMVLEGFDIDLSPIFAGTGTRYVAGVPFYSGGIFPTVIHYLDEFKIGNFPRLVLNSSAIALFGVALSLLVGLPAAYALARLRLRGKGVFSFLLLALRTVSPFAVILPIYLVFVRVGLWDTYAGMGLAYMLVILPVVVWLLKGFIGDTPREIYEAAEIFGGSERQIFWRITLPLLIPGIVVTSIFAFVLIWNEFLIADVLTGPAAKTVSVGVWAGTGESSGFRSIAWDVLNAGGTLAFIPAVTMMLVIRKYLAKGFSLATAR